jgi:hypothetical protein
MPASASVDTPISSRIGDLAVKRIDFSPPQKSVQFPLPRN